MDENITNVFHGFLNLKMKDKLKLVEAVNDYFDSMDRESIREASNEEFRKLDFSKRTCLCCEKSVG